MSSSPQLPTDLKELDNLIENVQKSLNEERSLNRILLTEAVRAWVHSEQSEDNLSELASILPYLSLRSESSLSHCLELTQGLSEWKCISQESKLKSVSGDGIIVKEWAINLSLEAHPAIVLACYFDTLSTKVECAPHRIEGLELHLSTKDDKFQSDIVISSEVQNVLDHCQQFGDIRSALRLIEKYLTLSKLRRDCLSDGEQGDNPSQLHIKNDHGCVLAIMHWNITFAVSSLSFSEEFSIEFTDKGMKASEECGFPEELISTGKTSFWTPQYCLENLRKMASLDESSVSPRKRKRKS